MLSPRKVGWTQIADIEWLIQCERTHHIHKMLFLVCAMLAYAVPAEERVTARTGSDVTPITGLEFSDFTTSAVWGGGAIHFDTPNSHTVSVNGCTFVSCWNGFWEGQKLQDLMGGGAIFANNVKLLCSECSFSQCIAKSGWGGAILCRDVSEAEISECNFTECQCDPMDNAFPDNAGGGAVCSRDRPLTLTNCNFTNCTCPQDREHDGGAVLALGDITCSECYFEEDVTKGGNGGAIWAGGDGKSTLYECYFNSCTAINAGAVYYDGGAQWNISSCFLDNCYGQAAEVASIYINATELTFDNVHVRVYNCHRSLIVLESTQSIDIYLTGCHIIGDEDTAFPDGNQCIVFPLEYQKVAISDSSFKDLKKESNGGGAFLFSAMGREIEFTRCDFENIVVDCETCNGGALSFPESSDNVIIYGCTFTGCSAKGHGGGIYGSFLDGGKCDIQDCTFINNSGGTDSNGQSLHIACQSEQFDLAKYVIKNCTFSDHTDKWPLCFQRSDKQPFSGLVTIADFVFHNNKCNENGLICVSASSISYENCHFNNNEGSVNGIVNLVTSGKGGICTFSNCVFDTCTAKYGGIIYTLGSVAEIVMNSCEFTNCSTGQEGAILTSEGCTNVTIEGGSIVECPGLAISLERHTINVYVAGVTFQNCGTGSQSGVIYSKEAENENGLYMTFEHCIVTDCGSENGILCMARNNISVLTISDNTFSNEDAELDAAMLAMRWRNCYIELLVIDSNNYTSNSRGSEALLLQKFGNLQLTENNFTLAVQDKSGISITFPLDVRQYRIEKCIFDNQGKIILGCAFLDLGMIGTDLSFIDCYFQNIESTVAGSGIFIRDGNPWNVVISGCHFVNLKTQGNGGAVYSGSVESLVVDECTFDFCSLMNSLSPEVRAGGGALYISAKTSKSAVSNCVFSNNASPMNGNSLQVMGSKDPPKMTLTNCTFKDHTGGPVLCFRICSDSRCNGLTPSTETLSISSCYFLNNKLKYEEFGLVKCTEYASSSFENCIFSNNANEKNGLLCFAVYEGSSCRFSDCVFNQSVSEYQMKSVINLMNEFQLKTLELSFCEFAGINTSSGLLTSNLIEKKVSLTWNILNCSFTTTSATGIFLNIDSPVFHLSGNNFTFMSEFGDESPITIQVANGGSIIEDSQFTLDGGSKSRYWRSIVTLQFSNDGLNDASLSIYNCCFVDPGIQEIYTAALFLTLAGSGTLKLSVVCFNAAQDKAIHQEQGSTVTVQYDTRPEDIFGDGCVCWVPPSIPEETSISQSDPSTPTQTSTNTDNPSFTPTSGTEEDPDDPESGSGGKANAGLIAGVTVAVIIIIIVVVVIVILILRSRRSNDSAEPESSSDELTEETITTFANKKPDFAEDWTNATEDNPIFGVDSVDQGNFTDQFEEEGTDNWFHE